MFGVSLGEIAVILVVALVAVGPERLPGMLRSLGEWMRKLRTMTSEVRSQTGIDEILRDEGLEGGLAELRSMLRGDLGGVVRGPDPYPPYAAPPYGADPYAETVNVDRQREYPPEGVDAAGAIPDDLLDDSPVLAAEAAPPSHE